ncbi:MAG: UDP-glucose/GDP-mannose dehydrogenase family protein [Nitrospirae bacterium]|nr:UDP-glucose/GDP-mannose dehydrogenase family protein [Nitrospirota bacterium]
MNISVIGAGYVGLVTGACFAEFGINVTCVDMDEARIESLTKGTPPFYEPGLEELMRKNMNEGRLHFTRDTAKAVRDSEIIFIAVGTPSRADGSADLSYVDAVARTIAGNLNAYKVIVTKSTVPVGTGERIRKIIQESGNADGQFDIVSNPEFLREGSAIEDFMRPNRVVIGANSERSVSVIKELYRPLYLIEAPFIITDIETSEMIKYASNVFLATKISYINEIANLCEKVGANVQVVAKAMGLDGRIGAKFLHPGPGYGGSCFPKDVRALLQIAESHGYDLKIARGVIEVNTSQREWMIVKIEHALRGISGKTLGVLGLSFKPNTNDIRESPAIDIIQGLIARGAKIRVFDPAAMQDAKAVLGPLVTYCKDAYDAAEGADAVVLTTEWNQFRNLELERLKGLLKHPVFIDLRNVYETDRMRKNGFDYYSVGRS